MLQLPETSRQPSRAEMAPNSFAIDRTGDKALWSLHDKFCAAHAKLLQLDTPLARQEIGSRAAERAHAAWERQLRVTDLRARAVIRAPAHTVHGALAKIHVAGWILDCVDRRNGFRAELSAPDHCWKALPGFTGTLSDELALILSLRKTLVEIAHQRATLAG